jgi:hypothetical protein
MMLDWDHLGDKCNRQLRLAMKGRVLRNERLDALTRVLWDGRVDRAIRLLRNVPKTPP